MCQAIQYFAYVYLVDSFLFQYEINDTNSRNQLSLGLGDIYIPYEICRGESSLPVANTLPPTGTDR